MLLVLTSYSIYSVWVVPYRTGLVQTLMGLKEAGAYLPAPASSSRAAEPVRARYSGIRLLDEAVVPMVGFFWPALDGARPDLSLVTFELVGQFAAAWVLIAVECWRLGQTAGWALPSVTIVGLLMHFVGYAVIPPMWMYLHLGLDRNRSPSTTTTTTTTTTKAAAAAAADLTLSNPLPLLTIPLSIGLGLFTPNVLILFFSPTGPIRQSHTALLQIWPLLFSAGQMTLPILIAVLTPARLRPNLLTEEDKRAGSASYTLGWCYPFAFLTAALPHAVYLLLPTLAYAFPALFDGEYALQLQPSHVYVPIPTSESQTDPTASKILNLTQWDLILGSASLLLWTLTLRLRAHRRCGGHIWAYQWLLACVKVCVAVVVVGPSAAAVAVMWHRDRLLFLADAGRGREAEADDDDDDDGKER